MAVDLKIERANTLSDGRLEVGYAVLVNGVVVAQDSMVFPQPHQLTLAQLRQALKDRVMGLKEQYKAKAQVDTLVGQQINVEP